MTFTLVTYLLQNELSPQTESKNLKNVTAEQCSMLEFPVADRNSSLESDFSLFALPLKHKDITLGLGGSRGLGEISPTRPSQREEALCRCQRDSDGYRGCPRLPGEFFSCTCG